VVVKRRPPGTFSEAIGVVEAEKAADTEAVKTVPLRERVLAAGAVDESLR